MENLKIENQKDYRENIRFLIIYYICFKLINNIMRKGKKDKAIKILNNIISLMAINILNNNFKKQSPFRLLIKLIYSISLPFRLKKKRIAGRNLFIPLFLLIKKQLNYSIRFLIKNAKERNNKTFELSLLNEILDIIDNNSSSISLKKKKEILKLAIENKYYIKYL
jgi:ribosomal protein S7